MASPTIQAMNKVKDMRLMTAGPMMGANGFLNPNFNLDNALQSDLESVLQTTVLTSTEFNRVTYKRQKPATRPRMDGYWGYGFAVVDLTKPASYLAPYAGWGDTDHFLIASMAKLLPFYAAFQMRSELRNFYYNLELINTAAIDIGTLAVHARERYATMRASAGNHPNIENMFCIESDKVEFKRQTVTDPDLNNLYYENLSQLNTLAFRERLRLMAGWSDNKATSLVMKDIGYEYLWALTQRGGLCRPRWNKLTPMDPAAGGPGGGLFLSTGYDGLLADWRNPPSEIPTIPPTQAGNARSIATLMTLLARKQLLGGSDHTEMLEMLRQDLSDAESRRASHATSSPLAGGMLAAGWNPTQTIQTGVDNPPDSGIRDDLVASKLGYLAGGPKSNVCDALIIRAKRPRLDGKSEPITAVLIAINASSDTFTKLSAFGLEMAKKLEERHKNDTD
jgi:hypothetical protein